MQSLREANGIKKEANCTQQAHSHELLRKWFWQTYGAISSYGCRKDHYDKMFVSCNTIWYKSIDVGEDATIITASENAERIKKHCASQTPM